MSFLLTIAAILLFFMGLNDRQGSTADRPTGYVELGLAVAIGVAVLFAEVLEEHLKEKRKKIKEEKSSN